MDFAAVLAQLSDLPSTFTRSGAPYTQYIDSLSSPLALFTNGTDAVVKQLTFGSTLNGWLDTWGLIFDLPRKNDEADSLYSARISETLLAWVGTVPALQVWINLFAPGGSIAEYASGVGYAITLPATLTPAQITAFFLTLSRIRPVGVPFTVNQLAGGLYLSTLNFLGEGRMPGAYLYSTVSLGPVFNVASTNNAAPQLPDLYFVDPMLNPSLV